MDKGEGTGGATGLKSLRQLLGTPRPWFRRPGRGVGEKRLRREALERLETIFRELQLVRNFLQREGHQLINDSGSLLAAQAHRNLDLLVALLEDFLWTVNCAIARYGGTPKLI